MSNMIKNETKDREVSLRIQSSLHERLKTFANEKKWSLNQAACVIFDSCLPKYEPSANNVG